MRRKYTANQAMGLVRLANQLSGNLWVPVSNLHKKQLGDLMDLIPTCECDGVEFFNYANQPFAIDNMLIDLIYDIHQVVRTDSQARFVILTDTER